MSVIVIDPQKLGHHWPHLEENLDYNLISAGKLADKGITSIFRAETVEHKIVPKNLFLAEEFVIVKTRASTSCLLLNNMNTLWFPSTIRKTLGPGAYESSRRAPSTQV
jgi:hypothetical protein